MGLTLALSRRVVWRMQDGKGGLAEDALPLLQPVDVLPGLRASIPYILTTYSGGASCDGSEAGAKRSAQVIHQPLNPVPIFFSQPCPL